GRQIREAPRAAVERPREADRLALRAGLRETRFHLGLHAVLRELRAFHEVLEAFGVELEHLGRRGRAHRRVARSAAEQADLAEEVAGLQGRDLALAIGSVLANARGTAGEDEERVGRIALADDRLAREEPA